MRFRRFRAVGLVAVSGVLFGCGPRATGAPPAATPAEPAATGAVGSSECDAATRTVDGWIASGRYGRALVAVRALEASSCTRAARLAAKLADERQRLGLVAAIPEPALWLELSRVRALRAGGQLDQARAGVQGLLAKSAGSGFVLAEAGLVEHAGGKPEAAQSLFERAMLAFGAPVLEPAEERYRDFAHVAFGAGAELWSCNLRLRVTDGNTLEPLLSAPLAEGCAGLDVSDGGKVATTRGGVEWGSFAEAAFSPELSSVRFSSSALLGISESAGGASFVERGPSGEQTSRALSLPESTGGLAISRDPEGSWTVVTSTTEAWAFDASQPGAPLALGGPAVAVRGKKAVVNLRNHAELIELPSRRRVRRVPIRDCPSATPPSADVSWAVVSRDASTVALSRCSSITTWRWDGAAPKPLATPPEELRATSGEVEPFALSRDGSLLARTSTHSLEVFDTRSGNQLRGVERAGAPTLTVVAAPSGALALTTGERRTFVVSESGALEGEVPVPGGCRPSWYGSDALMLQCGRDLARVARSGGRTVSKIALKSAANAVFALPPERAVVVRDQRSELVHLESGEVERELAGRVAWVSPDGKLGIAVEAASDGSSSFAVVSLSTGAVLAKESDRFVRAELETATGALLVLGAELWYFAPPAFRGKRLAERQALKPPPGTWPTTLRFSADQRLAVIGFGDGSTRSFELATARAQPAPVDAAAGLVWSGNRGYRRSDGKHVVSIEASPSGSAFSVTATSGGVEFLGAAPAALPVCRFGIAEFPFELCRDAVLATGLLKQLQTHGEWYGG